MCCVDRLRSPIQSRRLFRDFYGVMQRQHGDVGANPDRFCARRDCRQYRNLLREIPVAEVMLSSPDPVIAQLFGKYGKVDRLFVEPRRRGLKWRRITTCHDQVEFHEGNGGIPSFRSTMFE